MHTWHADIVEELARALLALPVDHPAVLALPPEAADALTWLHREREAEAELQAMRSMPASQRYRDYGGSVEIDRSIFDDGLGRLAPLLCPGGGARNW